MTARRMRYGPTSRLLWWLAYLVAVVHDAVLEWAFSGRAGAQRAWRLAIRLGALCDALTVAAVKRGREVRR